MPLNMLIFIKEKYLMTNMFKIAVILTRRTVVRNVHIKYNSILE